MTTLPTVITAAGLQPQSPASLNAQLLALVSAVVPGYTSQLPGSLVEDVGSTDTYAIVLCDQARVELVNSLTPYGANAFLLQQLGNIYGVPLGQATNTSVLVQFSSPNIGFVIAQGFIVSDGTNQYTVSSGGVIGSGGISPLLLAVAVNPGSWAVPAGTVVQIVTSVPSTITLTVANPEAGTPGSGVPTLEDYRTAVLQAGLAASQGMSRYLKTLLGNVSGVQPRLVSVIQNSQGGWEVLCGGGDPIQVAYAMYTALFDITAFVGSVLLVDNITNANPGVVTTVLNHGYSTGQVCEINGIVGMTELNGVSLTATVITETTFSIGIDTTSYSAYVSGGVVTPNLRNVVASIQDYPNTYEITYVNPPEQAVTMTVTWNTTATNFVAASAVAQLGAPALVAYVNSIYVGQPLNLFAMQETFQVAVASVLPPNLLTRMVFSVAINGIGVSPEVGTGIYPGDPESYFFCATNGVTIVQG